MVHFSFRRSRTLLSFLTNVLSCLYKIFNKTDGERGSWSVTRTRTLCFYLLHSGREVFDTVMISTVIR